MPYVLSPHPPPHGFLAALFGAVCVILLAFTVDAQPRRGFGGAWTVHVELSAGPPSDGEVELVFDVDADTDVVCTMDHEGDGIAERSFEDCENRERVTVTYDEAGAYFPTLVARTRDGRSGRATTRVVVR